ncbi:MAG: GTP-binding protein, partial [Paracoccaceae bacterium]|nr:GTP-binding protein [Paracoccaceae bacterium]
MTSPENLAVLARPAAPGRVPVTLLTGFLGAGKTTLLNQLMQAPEMATAAVFINEFGEIGIDHHLVERIDEALVILDSGCLCCTVQGDLIAELKRLHDRMARREIAPVSRVVIETTGLADPMPVVRALMEDRFT